MRSSASARRTSPAERPRAGDPSAGARERRRARARKGALVLQALPRVCQPRPTHVRAGGPHASASTPQEGRSLRRAAKGAEVSPERERGRVPLDRPRVWAYRGERFPLSGRASRHPDASISRRPGAGYRPTSERSVPTPRVRLPRSTARPPAAPRENDANGKMLPVRRRFEARFASIQRGGRASGRTFRVLTRHRHDGDGAEDTVDLRQTTAGTAHRFPPSLLYKPSPDKTAVEGVDLGQARLDKFIGPLGHPGKGLGGWRDAPRLSQHGLYPAQILDSFEPRALYRNVVRQRACSAALLVRPT